MCLLFNSAKPFPLAPNGVAYNPHLSIHPARWLGLEALASLNFGDPPAKKNTEWGPRNITKAQKRIRPYSLVTKNIFAGRSGVDKRAAIMLAVHVWQ